MRDEWRRGRLAEFAVVSTGPFGSLLHKSDYVDDGIPLVNPINMVDERIIPDPEMLVSEATKNRLNAYVLRRGDVIVGRRGEIGRCAVVGDDEDGWVCGTGSFFIRPNSTVDPQFLAYLIRSPSYRGALEAAATGSTMQNLSNSALGNLMVEVPSLSRQRQVVASLDDALDGISVARIYAEQNIHSVEALIESELGNVFDGKIEGARESALDEVCDIESSLVDPRLPEFLDLLHVGGANIESKTGRLLDLQSSKQEGLISGKFLFEEDAVLYSKIRPYLMKVARPGFRGLCSADIYPLTAKPAVLDRDYLFYLLLSPRFTEYAISGSARAGMPKVNRDHLFAFRAEFPPVEVQKRLAAKLDAVCEEARQLQELYRSKLAVLDELKKSILHHAFTGQL